MLWKVGALALLSVGLSQPPLYTEPPFHCDEDKASRGLCVSAPDDLSAPPGHSVSVSILP